MSGRTVALAVALLILAVFCWNAGGLGPLLALILLICVIVLLFRGGMR